MAFNFSEWLPAMISSMERRRDEEVPGEGRPFRLDDLCWELRVKIYGELSPRDRKSLRQVCHLFRAEIDNIIGVHAKYVGTKENHRWISSLHNLTGLTVVFQFEILIPEAYYFSYPFLLQKLVIHQGGFSKLNIMNVLGIFTHLKEFVLLPPTTVKGNPCGGIMAVKFHYLTVNDLIDLLIVASRNNELDTYSLSLMPITPETRLFREYNEDPEWDDHPWLYSNNGALKNLAISAAEMDELDQSSWLEYWMCEVELRTIDFDIGHTNGNSFEDLIQQSKATLTSIKLANILMSHNNTALMLRWNMFEGCHNLRILSLSAVRTGNEQPGYLFSAGIHDFNFEQLTELSLQFLRLTPTLFGRFMVCASKRLKVLDLQYFMMELRNKQLQQLDWTLRQGSIDSLTLCELTSKMVHAADHFEEFVYGTDEVINYCFMASEPCGCSTLLEFDKGRELENY